MAYFNDLPREIKDRIFLSLDFPDMLTTKQWQSIHVRRATQLNMIIIDANNGDLKSIKYLLESGYKLNKRTFLDQAKYSHEVTAFLLENGYKDSWIDEYMGDPWNGETFDITYNGNFQTMQWLL